MKNGLLIWNVVLSLVAGLLLFLQFSPKKHNRGTFKNSGKDSIPNHHFRIAYFEMDSVEANFNAVKDVKAEINAKETEYNNSLNQLDQAYKNKFNELSKENMTPEQADAAQNTLRQYGEGLKIQKQELDQKYQDFVMRKNLEIKKKIEDFIKEFNKTQNYSFIVTDDTGLFYYKDSVYNITSEVVKGLNENYKSQKK
jgi:outer membrane protein